MSEKINLTDAELRVALARAVAERDRACEERDAVAARYCELKELVAAYKEVIREMRETELCHTCRCMKFTT